MQTFNSLYLINTMTPKDVFILKQNGIQNLEDLAKLSEKEVQSLTQKLNFLEGRIQYEYWIEQAKDYIEYKA